MKTITSTLTGLASSLLFNAGFTGMAQQLDPMGQPVVRTDATSLRSAEICAVPCSAPRRKVG